MYVQMGFERSREDACCTIEVHAPIFSEAPQLGELIDIYLPITDLDRKNNLLYTTCYILPDEKNPKHRYTTGITQNLWPISGDFGSIVTILG